MQEAFYKENAKVFRVTECSIAPRFQQDGKEMLWKIRAISQAENVEIWKKSGENPKRYESMVLAASERGRFAGQLRRDGGGKSAGKNADGWGICRFAGCRGSGESVRGDEIVPILFETGGNTVFVPRDTVTGADKSGKL